ncbi:MAG: ATP-binding protein [Succinivibrio sp.]|nr:ATP-binding protein [Succinivibrio sp.]
MERPLYLDRLIRKERNGLIKVITGLRRSGKTYLLFNLFFNHLRRRDVREDHIIKIALDNRQNRHLRDPDVLYAHVTSQLKDQETYYLLLDEVQFVPEFEEVLNSFLHCSNVDVYVTGSNAKFLSTDVITQFRGRGDQIRLQPLTFGEFMSVYSGEVRQGWEEYTLYGGLPQLLTFVERSDKMEYLKGIVTETYLKDILERNGVRHPEELTELLEYLASAIGGFTSAKKLADTFHSVKGLSLHQETVAAYLSHFEDSFLVSRAKRYDVKGRRYISTPAKFYFSDVGLRNAVLNFRQYEETHLLENIIYNELLSRGYAVDVGMVERTASTAEGRRIKSRLEVDFVCNLASKRLYVQSALALPDRDKEAQEQSSLLQIRDAFKKIIIAKDVPTHYNEQGILILNLFDFLLRQDALEAF